LRPTSCPRKARHTHEPRPGHCGHSGAVSAACGGRGTAQRPVAGSYQQSPGAAPAGTDPKALVEKNEKGVVIVLEVKVETGTNPYLALDISDHDVKVTLER
jgi:hypothetical protein